jgi:hypothetical protein
LWLLIVFAAAATAAYLLDRLLKQRTEHSPEPPGRRHRTPLVKRFPGEP